MLNHESILPYDYNTSLIRVVTSESSERTIAFLCQGVVLLTAREDGAVIFSRYTDNPPCANFFTQYWFRDIADICLGQLRFRGSDNPIKITNLLTVYPEWPNDLGE